MLSRRQKIIIVAVFVLLVVLYTGAAATGGGSGQGDAGGHQGGIVGWLGGAFGKPPAVARTDVSAPCLSEGTLTVKGSCTLTVRKSTQDTRRLELHATDAVTVTSRAPEGSDTVTADVDAGKDVSVTVDDKGGDVVITCPGDSCVVTLP